MLEKPFVGDCPSHWMYYIPLFPNPFPHVGRCELIHKSQTFNPLSAFPRLLSATCLTWSRTQLALFARETQFWELSKQCKIANANTWEKLVILCKKTGSKLIYFESMPHLYWKGKTRKLCKNRWMGNESRPTFKNPISKTEWGNKRCSNTLIMDKVSECPSTVGRCYRHSHISCTFISCQVPFQIAAVVTNIR